MSIPLTIFALFCAAVATIGVATNAIPAGGIPRSYECTDTPNDCTPGLVCAGHPWRKTCVVAKNPGMQCLIEPFWVCRSELVCENDVCKIPRGGSCTKNPDHCAQGLSCDGKGTEKRCITYKTPGMGCPVNELFWICQSGLTCENNVCKIPRGGRCNDSPTQCASGLNCDGKLSAKRCIMYKEPGMRCPANEQFWICRPGLTCQGNVCKIPVGGSCSSSPRNCVSGAMCSSSAGKQSCVPVPRKLGEKCDRTFRCESGLACEGECKIAKKERCEKNPTMCVRGTACVGVRRKKFCMPPVKLGGRCGTIGFHRCTSDLVCHRSRCVHGTQPMGASCLGGKICQVSLVCAGTSRKMLCMKPMQKGELCKGDPFWKCANGLHCANRHCVEY